MSKTLLNALTGWLAVELKGTPIKVNSVCPGYNTDMNGNRGTQHPSEGAKSSSAQPRLRRTIPVAASLV